MKNINADMIFYMIFVFLGLYIALQIYLILKLKTIIKQLFDILFQFHDVMNKLHLIPGKVKTRNVKNCQNCKYRLPFYNSQQTGNEFIYYRCQISHKKVASDYYCSDFVFDSQIYDT